MGPIAAVAGLFGEGQHLVDQRNLRSNSSRIELSEVWVVVGLPKLVSGLAQSKLDALPQPRSHVVGVELQVHLGKKKPPLGGGTIFWLCNVRAVTSRGTTPDEIYSIVITTRNG